MRGNDIQWLFLAFIKKKINNAIQLLRAAALENKSALTLLIIQPHLYSPFSVFY